MYLICTTDTICFLEFVFYEKYSEVAVDGDIWQLEIFAQTYVAEHMKGTPHQKLQKHELPATFLEIRVGKSRNGGNINCEKVHAACIWVRRHDENFREVPAILLIIKLLSIFANNIGLSCIFSW